LWQKTELGRYGQVVVIEVVDHDLPVADLHELHARHLHALASGSQLGAVGQQERTGVRPDEHPLVCERVALLDVADIAMGDIRERSQLLGESVLDCASALEGAVGHQLRGVLCVQIHHAVEITCVVQLDVSLQEASVTIHCPSPLLVPSQITGHEPNLPPRRRP
jgi:hypothetical protein